MKVLHGIAETKDYLSSLAIKELTVGFVPTMGALHPGHLSLVEQAKRENQRVVVSIFVNPIQFNNPEDLKKYPRDLTRDLGILANHLSDEDLVFAPESHEMYPKPVREKYDFGDLATVMEGAHRPGHFNGVGVVINRLFEIIEPNRAYFGEKDYQQIAIIKKLTEIEKHAVEIIPCSIIRESDGLAMSSRNARLTHENRTQAAQIYQQLQKAQQDFLSGRKTKEIEKQIITTLNNIKDFKVEYFTIANEDTLQTQTTQLPNPQSPNPRSQLRGFIAVFAGEIRLIDNIPMY